MKLNKVINYILLLFLFLSIFFVRESLWIDEATSANVVRNFSLIDIVNVYSRGDFHPPLYYLTLKLWSLVFGTTEIGIRSLSILFSLGTIVSVYLIGVKLKDKNLGLVSALFLATGPLFVYYASEARMYSMVTFLVTLLIYFFIKLIDKPKTIDWFWFSVILSCVFLTEYLGLFVLPAFFLYAYQLKKKKKWWSVFLKSHIVLLFVFAGWFSIFQEQLGRGLGVKVMNSNWWNVLGVVSLKNVALFPVKLMIGRIGFDNKFLYGAIIVTIGILFAFLIRIALAREKKAFILVYWLVVPVLVAVLISFKISILTYFRFIYVLPAMYLLIGWGLISLKEKYFLPVLVTLLLINFSSIAIYLKNEKFHREDWRGLTEFVSGESVGKEYKLIFVHDSQMEAVKYYTPEMLVEGPGGIESNLKIIWLMRYVSDIYDKDDSVLNSIVSLGYVKTTEYSFNKLPVWKFEKIEEQKMEENQK